MQTGKLTLEKSSGSWAAWKPDGTSLSISGTSTDGLQECINSAHSNGWQLEVVGTADITCASSINIPADAERMNVHLACGIHFGPMVQYALCFNSFLHSRFIVDGEIKYTYDGRYGGGGAAVAFSPQASSSHKLIVDNDIYIRRVFGDGCVQGTQGVLFSTNEGTITRNRFYVHEIEGGNPNVPTFANGISVTNTNGNSFSGNKVQTRALLIWTDAGIRVGNANNGMVNKNVWEVNIENSAATSKPGIITYATNDIYTATVSGNITTAFDNQGSSNAATVK